LYCRQTRAFVLQAGLGDACKSHAVLEATRIYGTPNNASALIAAGRAHSILVTDDVRPEDDDVENAAKFTQVYSWGSGNSGRLGVGSQQDAHAPELVPYLDGEELLGAACGHDHTLILASM
jgi:Regulator of chromosome condensation (RCC1) repeat